MPEYINLLKTAAVESKRIESSNPPAMSEDPAFFTRIDMRWPMRAGSKSVESLRYQKHRKEYLGARIMHTGNLQCIKLCPSKFATSKSTL